MNSALLRPGVIVAAAIASVLAVVVLANVRLVYVAVQSHPECVTHLKEKGEKPGMYRAADSAC